MKGMTRVEVQNFRREMNDAIAPILEKYGLTGELGNLRYSSVERKETIQRFIVEAPMAPVKSAGSGKVPVEFARMAPRYGLSSEHYGVTIKWGKDLCTLRGFEPNRPKWCLVVDTAKGERLLPRTAIAKFLEA